MKGQLSNLALWHWMLAGAGLLLLVGLGVALGPEAGSGPPATKAVPASPASIVMEVKGMYCSGCAQTVEEKLSGLSGVKNVRANLRGRGRDLDRRCRIAFR